MLKIHSYILIICSVIAFTGHYLQFNIVRFTPWIPAIIGVIILLLNSISENHKPLKYLLPFIVLAFGITTTIMCIRFLPQDFQPIRKKIIFSIISISAWIAIFLEIRKLFTAKNKQH